MLTGDYQVDATHQDHDVGPDGGALPMVKSAEGVSRVIVVHRLAARAARAARSRAR